MTRSWVKFQLNERGIRAKTDTWEVWGTGSHVGKIRWHSPWRKYCFFPMWAPLFDEDCLRQIAEFIETQTAMHRKGKRAFSV